MKAKGTGSGQAQFFNSLLWRAAWFTAASWIFFLWGQSPDTRLLATSPLVHDQPREQASAQNATQQKIANLRAAVRRAPGSAQAHNDLGIALGEAGNLPESIRELETAVRLKKDYAQAYYNLGIAWVTAARLARAGNGNDYAKDLDNAFSVLHRASELQPTLPNIHNLLGWLYEEIGDVPSAIREFQRAIQQQPNSADAYNNLGTAYARQRDYVKAAGAYARAAEIDPHLVKAELNLESAVQLAWGREKVLDKRRELVQRAPRSAVDHALLGHALLFNDRLSQAEGELRKAVELEPNLAIAWFYLGEVLQRLGDSQGGLNCFDRAVKLSPETPEFFIKRGVLLLRMDKVKEAIADLRQAVALDPDDASSHYVLATAFQRAGQRTEAAQEFQAATRLNNAEREKENAGLFTINGIRDLRAGKVDDAVRELRQAVARKPDYPEANYYLGIALAQKGDNKESIEAFERALARRPQSAEIHYNFGIALWQMGKATAALHEFRRAVNLRPDDGLARCALGKALLHQGKTEEGQRELKRAQRLGACVPNTN